MSMQKEVSPSLNPEGDRRPTLPPHGFFLFLERIGLIHAAEISHPYPEQITQGKLAAAHRKGPKHVQTLKNKYINELIEFRVSPPHSLGTSMKARAQQLIQSTIGLDGKPFGDPATWLLDPLDRESCLAVADDLLSQGRTNFWISGAMTGDFSDALSNHKNQRMPILGHEKDPYTDNILPATNIQELSVYLDSVEKFIRDERIIKLSRKLARASNPGFKKLLTPQKRIILEEKREAATKFIDYVGHDPDRWAELNEYLAKVGQPPLDQQDHALIKLFPQDNSYNQVGDLRIEGNSLILEFTANQFTHREAGGILENKPKIRFEITQTPEGKPLILADTQSMPYLAYLYPMLNSKNFWQKFDRKIIPLLGNSPYHQIEFMYKLQEPAKTLNSENLERIMYAGQVDFIIDIITGIHASNQVSSDQKYKNGDKNALNNYIAPLLQGIGEDLSGAVIRYTAEHELIQNNNFASSLYKLALKCTPGHQSALDHASLNPHQPLDKYDREIAHGLLTTYPIWKDRLHIPPSTLHLLQDITKYGQTQVSAMRTLLMLENQLKIAEIIDIDNGNKLLSNIYSRAFSVITRFLTRF